MIELFFIIDLVGTFVFAISGALSTYKHKIDLFGIGILSFVTALGGGTVRDVLIGNLPIGWMLNIHHLAVVGLGILVTILFHKRILKFKKPLMILDALGIGMFTISGLQLTLNIGLSQIIGVMMGMVSAVFGGLIRDLLTNQVPVLMRKELYATPCLAGAVLYLILVHFQISTDICTLASIAFICSFRLLAIFKDWELPTNEYL